ncbi:hypothetical protein [Bacillus toyonensis]|uniref:hypothetical protein n=1 Tax=Bacillus toyonensis TaxID=155322 RepID=UPI000BF80BFF|nr:hypothetical protein [Bacillus toyonensis]PEO80824.1 hypothetical protein CN570_08250 [Bacillus toyonensis]
MKIELLEKKHIQEATDLIATAFVQNEPLVSYIQVPLFSYKKICEEMVAVILCRKAERPLIDKQTAIQICPPVAPILQLLADLEEKSAEFLQLPKGNLIYFDMGACHPKWMGKGITSAINMLISHTLTLMAENQSNIITACTNKISNKLWTRQYQAIQLNEIVYDSFGYQDNYPFAGITSSTAAQLLYMPTTHIIEGLAKQKRRSHTRI